MKKITSIIFSLFILLSYNSKAQYVTIPDANFRTWLNTNGFSSAMSGNQLDTTNSLVTSATSINCTGTSIADLTGIQYFDNLKSLNCSACNALNNLSVLPSHLDTLIVYSGYLSNLPNLPSTLKYLNCGYLNLTILPALPNGLLLLDCSYNSITTLPTLPNGLTYLDFSNCSVASLSALPSGLNYLNCYNNYLTTLPTLPNSLTTLDCSYNALMGLPTLPSGLISLKCDFCKLHTLPTIPASLDYLSCFSDSLSNILFVPNSSLRHINITGNQFTTLPALPNGLKTLICSSNLLTSISAFPDSLSYFDGANNNFTAFPNFSKNLDTILCSYNPNLHCLPLLPNGLGSFDFSNTGIQCVPNYPQNIYVPYMSNVYPICNAGNANACSVFTTFHTINQAICSGSSITFNGHNISTAGTYYDTLINYLGSDSIITLNLTINPLPVASFSAFYNSCFHTNTCAIVNFNGTASAGLAYNWNWNGGTLQAGSGAGPLTVCYSTNGTHAVSLIVTDLNGCTSAIFTDTIALSTACVWPGDADANHVADQYDLLPIGLGYGFTGNVRSNATNSWIDQPCNNWGTTQINGANFKHADCNGDGMINVNDTLPIAQNFGLTHARLSNNQPFDKSLPTLYIHLSPDTVYNGTQITASIALGDANLQATNVYGLAFNFNFDPLVTDTNTVQMQIPTSWLFTSATDHFSMVKYFRSAGNIKGGVIRNDHQNKSGYGTIITVTGDIISGNIAGKINTYKTYIVHMLINGLVVVDNAGNQLSFNIVADSSRLLYIKSGINSVSENNKLSIYPNPATQELTVSGMQFSANTKLEVLNMLGQIVLTQNVLLASTAHKIEIATLPADTYIIKVTDAEGNQSYGKFVKE